MVAGGDIDRNALKDSFARIKEDIARLNQEIYELKNEQRKLLEENTNLKKEANEKRNNTEPEFIKQIILETLKNLPQPKLKKQDNFFKKINKKRKTFLKSRIELLAEQKNMSLSEIKEIIVDHEELCSKATFYRHIDKMKSRGIIDFLKIEDQEVVVKIN